MSERTGERRREPRIPAEGTVELLVDEPVLRLLEGRLVDYSAGGFRATHNDANLTTGTRVRFRHSAGEGEARVVWLRILGDDVESGFIVL